MCSRQSSYCTANLRFDWFSRQLVVRRGGLMVSALVSRSSGPGLNPGWGHCVVFLGKATLTVALSTPVYKWVLANLNAGGSPAMH